MNQTIRKRIDDINNGIIPEGYKRTPFGVFPCDWETDKTFYDLFEFNSSLSKSREELGEKGYAYLHYGDMHRNSFNKISYEQYSVLPKVDVELENKENYLLQDGDVAFLDASEDLDGTSRCVLIDNPNNSPFFAGLHTIPAREKGNTFSKWYKQYITLPDFVRKQFQRLASGFKVYGLNKVTIARIAYAFPKNKSEQSKIADILMKWDEAIELQEQYIQKLETRKKAIMKKLLAPQNEWRCVSFELACKKYHYSKKLQTNQYQNYGKYPVVDQGKNYIVAYTDNESYIINEEQEELLLFGDHTTEIKYINFCFAVGGDGVKLFISNGIYGLKFVYYSLLNSPFLIEGYKRHSNILMKKCIWIPFLDGEVDLSEQKRIVDILTKVDETISLQKEKLEKLKKQRKAMQQYLLTGIVRVN